MARLTKAKSEGNVTFLERRKSWFEAMDYSELLAERRFMRAEKERVEKARKAALKVDPRGMWCECHEIDRMFKDMLSCCDTVIEYCEREMIARFGKEPAHD